MSGIIAAAGITAAAGLAGGLLSSGKGSGGVQSQTQQQQIDPGMQAMGRDNWDLAVQTANQLQNPYGGQRVADMTPEQRALIQQLYGNVGSTNAGYDQALAMTNGLAGFNSGQITPQTLAGANLNPYMNPYSSAVINPAMQQMEAARKQSLMQIGDQASQARAFGGSRQGIAEGTQNAASELQRGQYVGQMMGQNFAQAQAAATGDITRDIAAQQANMGARQFDAGFQGNLANQIANLSSGRQQNFLSGLTAAMGGQEMLQKNQQDQLAAQMQYYNEQRQQPLDVLQIRQNALAQQPYSQTSMSTRPGPSTDPWMTGLGTAGTVGGLIGTLGKAFPNASGYTTNDQMRTTDAEIANWSRY